MKRVFKLVALVGAFIGSVATADACTNIIVTKGASQDGSNIVTAKPSKLMACCSSQVRFQSILQQATSLKAASTNKQNKL